MLILHVYHPDKRRDDQVATWAALWVLAVDPLVPIVHYKTTGADGYWKALEAVWHHSGDIVVLEQDIVPRPHHVAELAECDHGYCAWDFNLAHGIPWSEVDGGHGFGLAKFSRYARFAIEARPQVPHVAWPDTVPALHERLAPVHIHRPLIEHHHGLA